MEFLEGLEVRLSRFKPKYLLEQQIPIKIVFLVELSVYLINLRVLRMKTHCILHIPGTSYWPCYKSHVPESRHNIFVMILIEFFVYFVSGETMCLIGLYFHRRRERQKLRQVWIFLNVLLFILYMGFVCTCRFFTLLLIENFFILKYICK